MPGSSSRWASSASRRSRRPVMEGKEFLGPLVAAPNAHPPHPSFIRSLSVPRLRETQMNQARKSKIESQHHKSSAIHKNAGRLPHLLATIWYEPPEQIRTPARVVSGVALPYNLRNQGSPQMGVLRRRGGRSCRGVTHPGAREDRDRRGRPIWKNSCAAARTECVD